MSSFKPDTAPCDRTLPQVKGRSADWAGIGDFPLRRWMLKAICILLFAALPAASVSSYARGQSKQTDTTALEMMLDLASDFARADPSVKAEVLALLEREFSALSQESDLVDALFATSPDSHYRAVVPAKAAQAVEYLRASGISNARFKAAQAAGDREWIAKHLKAAQEYAALAAKALIAEAQTDKRDGDRLQVSRFLMRRPPEQQAVSVDKMKTNGLSPEHRKLLLDRGETDAEIQEFQKQLLESPTDHIGRTAIELMSEIAADREELARQLNVFAQASPGAVTGTNSQAFVVGNPHDKEETIDLFIRPISIPPDWKLSLLDVEEQAKVKVREIEPGKHYAVTLPAKVQLNVASVVVPVGEVGTNTTARWAVEGKIGEELIGGMVHEMNVPYLIPDLKLPPVGSKEQDEPQAPASRGIPVAATAAAGIVVLFAVAVLVVKRRRRA